VKTLTALILLFGLHNTCLPQETIRITNGEWEPFLSEYSYEYGLDSHIVSEAFKLEDIDVIWGFFPWIRAYQLAKKGTEWDASCCWWPAKESKDAFKLSTAISNTSFVFFHLKTNQFDWENLNDLSNLKIGGTLEYDYGKNFMSAIKNEQINVELVPTDEKNFKKLLHNRIDIFPNDPIVGKAQIRNNLPPEKAKLITHHPKKFELTTLHLIISNNTKKQQFFLDKFHSGLNKLKQSGQLDQMLKDLDNGKYDKKQRKWK